MSTVHGLLRARRGRARCPTPFSAPLRGLWKLRSPVPAALASIADEELQVCSRAMEFGLSCTQGPRETMEDEVCVIPDFKDSMYAAVFDGHGGSAAAEWLHDHLQDYLEAAMEAAPSPEAALHSAFTVADAELLAHLSSQDDEEVQRGAGSTASVVLATPDRLVTANIGDSSAVLMRNGKPVELTIPHRVSGRDPSALAEIDRVKSVGGWVGDGRVCEVLAVSRAFGDWEFKGEGLHHLLSEGVEMEWWTKEFANSVTFTGDPVTAEPAVTTTPLGEEYGDEFMVVASDGLWDFYKQDAALSFARKAFYKGMSAQAVADGLVDRAVRRYTSDNVAVVVIKFPWFTGEVAKPVKNGGRKRFGLF